MTDAPRLAALLDDAGQSAAAERDSAPPPVGRILEAMLFAGGQPLTADLACGAVRGLSPDDFGREIELLARRYRRQNRPYAVARHPAGGYHLDLKPRFRTVADRLEGQRREARLTPPLVDTLTLVAYLQPVERGRVDSIRGRDSAGLLRQLVRLGLIATTPPAEGSRETRYSTTPRFLSLFGLAKLEDLPRTADVQQL